MIRIEARIRILLELNLIEECGVLWLQIVSSEIGVVPRAGGIECDAVVFIAVVRVLGVFPADDVHTRSEIVSPLEPALLAGNTRELQDIVHINTEEIVAKLRAHPPLKADRPLTVHLVGDLQPRLLVVSNRPTPRRRYTICTFPSLSVPGCVSSGGNAAHYVEGWGQWKTAGCQ